MVNEDIITSLKNAIAHGESIDSAMNTAITSGYNKRDVEEAARYVGGNIIGSTNPRPGESLTMPNKKGFFSKNPKNPSFLQRQPQQSQNLYQRQSQPPQKPLQNQYQRQPYQQQRQPQQKPIQQSQENPFPPTPEPKSEPQQSPSTLPEISSDQSQNKNQMQMQQQVIPEKTKEKKKHSYIKEIILLILLLLLVGILILTVKYKEQIIGFFS